MVREARSDYRHRVSQPRLDLPVDPDHQVARVRQFLRIAIVVAYFFGLMELAALVLFGDPQTGAAGAMILASGMVLVLAWRWLDRGRLETAVNAVWSMFIAASIGIALVQPAVTPVLVLVPLLAATLVLPYRRGQALGRQFVVCALAAVAIATLGVIEPVPTSLPTWFLSPLIVSASGSMVGLALFLLWQFSGRLTAALEQSYAVNTDLRRARALLEAEHERLEVTLRSIADGVIATDAAGRVSLLNGVAERLTGWSQADATGRPLTEVFAARNEGDRAPIEDLLTRVIDRDASLAPGAPVLLAGQAGSERTVEVGASPMHLADGSLAGVVIVFRDVTTVRRVEEERRTMERRMQETQKLESLGMLAGGIAHDFNNLLVAILGNASLALSELAPESPVRENVEQIEVASQRAADLARQMLAYSGKGRFVIQILDLNSIVREIAHLLSVSVAKSVHVRYDLDPTLPPIEGDATQLRQVVMNLVVNAGEAIGEQVGTVRIRTAAVDADERYLRGALVADELQPGRYVTLEVVDTGSGMDPATRERIFDPFFTTKFTGRGLGLAAVLGIVRGHGGTIRVYSEPGRGSSFNILLPVAERGLQPAKVALPAESWTAAGTILVVDDEPAVRAMAVKMLAPTGLSAVTAVDGVDAVARFEAEPDRFSLVLLDLTMPRRGGVETFEAIRRIRPQVPIVLMSGYAEEEASARFVGRGLAGFLQKPFTLAELVTALQSGLGPHSGSTEP
jgi:two-component system, cell cycle sensor histidine kinase and response regulator CckA